MGYTMTFCGMADAEGTLEPTLGSISQEQKICLGVGYVSRQITKKSRMAVVASRC